MRGRVARCLLRIGGTAALVCALAGPSPALAGTVHPLITSSQVSGLRSLVPLDRSGDRIAFVATAGGTESIWTASADGTNLQALGQGPIGAGVLVPSGDMQWISRDGSKSYVNVTSGQVRTLGGEQPLNTVSGPGSTFYLVGRPMRVYDAAAGSVKVIPYLAGRRTLPVSSLRRLWTMASQDGSSVGVCDQRMGGAQYLGLLVPGNSPKIVLTSVKSPRAPGAMTHCMVSNDGRTVAAVVPRPKHGFVAAVRRGKVIHVPLPAPEVGALALSPSGRFAFVDYPSHAGAVIDLQKRVAHTVKPRPKSGWTIELENGRGIGSTAVAWAPGDGRAVLPDFGGTRLFAVNPVNGAARALAQPTEPGGSTRLAPTLNAAQFSDDGTEILDRFYRPRDDSVGWPFKLSLKGGAAPTYLGGDGVDAFGSVVRSADRSHAWLVTCTDCTPAPKVELYSLDPQSYWITPFSLG